MKTKKNTKKKVNLKYLLIAVISLILVAFLGNILSSQGSQSSWYDSVKPSITPPSIVFPIVWTILFMLIAISFYFALNSSTKKDLKMVWLVYGINFIINILWSLFFFNLKLPIIAFIDVLLLLGSIVWIMLFVWKRSKPSFYLIVPYLIWVTFATILNLLIIL